MNKIKKKMKQERKRSNSVVVPTPLLSLRKLSEMGDRKSEISFKQWHLKMQTEHEILIQQGKVGKLWKPFRWLDSIPYEKKICKCCFKFQTCKSISFILLVGLFCFLLMFSALKEEVLPGGTFFFIFTLIFLAYVVGFISMFAGLPPLFGNLLVGVVAGNLPKDWLPPHDPEILDQVTSLIEKACLLIAIIRAGLLLDISRIKGRFVFITLLSFFPSIVEFTTIMIVSHYLLDLPWVWSSLLGSILSIVSLACITSVMEKSKASGLGEDKHLSTVLIAASSVNVILGIMTYIMCTYLASGGFEIHALLILIVQIIVGLSLGIVVGLFCAFIPDRRNPSAGILRIVVIGLGSFSFAAVLNENFMPATALLSVVVMCIVASNMWEELGWHDVSNPVQYFYTVIYYLCQPAVLSLVGFTMNFTDSTFSSVGLCFSVIVIGLMTRQVACVLMTLSHLYPTTKKEKIFICVAWLSKGTFQALLSYGAGIMILQNMDLDDEDKALWESYTKTVKQTTVLAILLITPVTTYALALLAPILLSKHSPKHVDESEPSEPSDPSKSAEKQSDPTETPSDPSKKKQETKV